MTEQGPKTAFLDCFSGISGDMMLGALLDCGVPAEVLHDNLARLHLDGWEIDISSAESHGLKSTRIDVRTNEKHPRRTLADIASIIESSGLSGLVKQRSMAVFRTLAEAEADIHGCSVQEIHFHEVGAVDAIIDIVGTAILLESLQVSKIICSPLPMPSGWVECSHGNLPLPAPATCKILQSTPVYGVDCDTELVTPTGAALVKTLSHEFGRLPPMTLQNTGYGAAGSTLCDRPNLLRILIGTTEQVDEAQTVVVTECNLDDWSPEGFPYLYEKLFELGALDVSLSPLQMKKGRPGFLLQVISDLTKAVTLQQCILSETTAIGLRYRKEQRVTLPRSQCRVNTRWGKIIAKRVETPSGTAVYPEYEECRKIALHNNVPLQAVYLEVAQGKLGEE